MTDLREEDLIKEVKVAEEEIRQLKLEFDSQVMESNEEIDFLKEKLMAQQEMLKIAIDYAAKLGKELKTLQKRIDTGNFHSLH